MTSKQIKYACQEINGVKRCEVLPQWYGNGTIRLVLKIAEQFNKKQVIDEVSNIIKNILPLGCYAVVTL